MRPNEKKLCAETRGKVPSYLGGADPGQERHRLPREGERLKRFLR